MDKIEQFDEELKKINSYDSLINNVLKGIYSVMGVLTLAVIVPQFFNWYIFKLNIVIISAVTAIAYLSPYLYVKSGGVMTSLFWIMREVPFDRMAFKKSRMKYLIKYEVKFIGCFAAIRAIIFIFFISVSVQRIIESIIVLVIATVTMYVSGIIYINRSLKC